MSLDLLIGRVITAAREGGCSELDIAAMRLLVVERREYSTIALAMRVTAIESGLGEGIDGGERCAIVCERLGISRSHYYDLKKMLPVRLTTGLSTGSLRSNVGD